MKNLLNDTKIFQHVIITPNHFLHQEENSKINGFKSKLKELEKEQYMKK